MVHVKLAALVIAICIMVKLLYHNKLVYVCAYLRHSCFYLGDKAYSAGIHPIYHLHALHGSFGLVANGDDGSHNT